MFIAAGCVVVCRFGFLFVLVCVGGCIFFVWFGGLFGWCLGGLGVWMLCSWGFWLRVCFSLVV